MSKKKNNSKAEDRNKSLLGKNAIFTPEVIDDIHIKAQLGRYRMRGMALMKKIPTFDDLVFLPGTLTRFVIEGYREKCETKTIIGPRCKNPIELDIPVYITGMSFGALSYEAKTALARGATMAGSATCPFSMLNTFFGTVVGYLTLCLPLAVVLQLISLSNVDRRLIEAAHNLGCSSFRTVFAVIIPLAKIGIIVAAVFCFILSFGDFVSPYYLGGSKPPTLSILIIDTTKSGQQWPRAAVVAITMIVTLFTIMFTAIALAYRRR